MELLPHLSTYVQGIQECPTALCTSLKLTKVKPGTSAGEKNKGFLQLKYSPLFSPSQSCPQHHHLFIQKTTSPSPPILRPKPENTQEAAHRTFCALDHGGLYRGIIENKKRLANVTTVEAWEQRQGLLQLPADETTSQGYLHPTLLAPGSVSMSLEEMLRAMADSEPEGTFPFYFIFFPFLKDSFSHPFGFKIVCGSHI